jgi:hypothetical protein
LHLPGHSPGASASGSRRRGSRKGEALVDGDAEQALALAERGVAENVPRRLPEDFR